MLINKKLIFITILLGALAFAVGISIAFIELVSISSSENTTNLPSNNEALHPSGQIYQNTDEEVLENKQSYSVAIVGDSMVDTMGEDLNYLEDALESKYPDKEFEFYNYGMGAQTMYQAHERWNDDFIYKTRDFPSLPELKPDIIIVASFAYNPVYPFEKDKHWSKLAELIGEAKQITNQVYILAEVAPLGSDFGIGAGETSGWSDEQRLKHSEYIVQLLENAIQIGKVLEIPVIDAYTETKANGNFGDGTYTDKDDGIHPSAEGHKLTAEKIVETIEIK